MYSIRASIACYSVNVKSYRKHDLKLNITQALQTSPLHMENVKMYIFTPAAGYACMYHECLRKLSNTKFETLVVVALVHHKKKLNRRLMRLHNGMMHEYQQFSFRNKNLPYLIFSQS